MHADAATPQLASVEPDSEPDGQVGPNDLVTTAWVYDESVTYSWFHCFFEMHGWDFAHHYRLMRGGYVAIHHGTDGLVQARNLGVKTFLEERNADWLLWLDTDMGFAPDTADRLFEVADPIARPVVGALCFAQRQVAPDEMGGWTCLAQPTIFDYRTVGERTGFTPVLDYPEDTVMRAKGTGSACILVHRSVFERVHDRFGQTWYSRIPNPTMGEMTSEDLSFCMRMGACDIPLHVHTGVRTTHAKSVWVSEREYRAQVELGRRATESGPAQNGAVPDGVKVVRTAVPDAGAVPVG